MYYTYIIRCRDNSLYTGYTIDNKRRLREHTKGYKIVNIQDLEDFRN